MRVKTQKEENKTKQEGRRKQKGGEDKETFKEANTIIVLYRLVSYIVQRKSLFKNDENERKEKEEMIEQVKRKRKQSERERKM